MSESPADDGPQTHDPADIYRRLPADERDQFLGEYRAALDAAHDVWRYRQLREVLDRWSLIATATSRPGYRTALDEAWEGAGDYTSLQDLISRRHSATR